MELKTTGKTMKKTIIIAALLSATTTIFSQSTVKDWENPQFYELNKEAPHAGFMLFNSQQDVIKDDYSRSPYYQSLNGSWKFLYADKQKDRSTDFYRTDLNT